MTATQWKTSSVFQRTQALHDEVREQLSPGIVGYVDGSAAGWIRVGPRIKQRRILNSRVMKSGTREPLESVDVWAVTCFSIRSEYRRIGLSAALLDAAIAYARTAGARLLEAYPIDNEAARHSNNTMFVGALTTFARAGFDIVARPTPSRVVVSLSLG